MTDKEKIRAEVKRRKDELHYLPFTDENLGKINAYEFVLKIIDSLPEEPVSEDLLGIAMELEETIGTSPHSRLTVVEHLVKAANWQKEQIMKGAIQADVNTYECVGESSYVEFVVNLPVSQFRKEDKVKLIIVKED